MVVMILMGVMVVMSVMGVLIGESSHAYHTHRLGVKTALGREQTAKHGKQRDNIHGREQSSDRRAGRGE
jgi:hypothetical protein